MRIIENKIENHRLKSVTNHGLKSITNHRLKSMATINHRINSMATKSAMPSGIWMANLRDLKIHRLKSITNHRLKSMATKSVVPYGTWITNPVGMIDLVTLGFIPGLRPERQRQALPIESHKLKSNTNHRLKSMATMNHRINSMATKSVVPYGTWITNPGGMIDFETLGFIPGLMPERQGQKSPIGATDIHIYLTKNPTKN
jgi:hypothetical protein